MAGARTHAPRTAPARAAPVRRVVTAPRLATDTARLIQPALRVGAVNDPAEIQAIEMARRVEANSTPAPPPSPSAPPTAAPLRRGVDDQPNTDSLTAPPIPANQADFDLPAAKDVPTEALDSGDVDEIAKGEPADLPDAQPARRTPAAVVGREGGMAPADVAARVANPGTGRMLSPSIRSRMAPHFGTTFEDVRLHDQSADRDAAARIGARAFTHGRDIWLGPGESADDTALMAHELTHVVQQTTGADTLPHDLPRDAVRRDEDEGYFAGKAESYARQVPGYTLITVLYGKTLISGVTVQMSATNLLGGLFGLVPGGTAIFDKLNETHAIEDAFAWVKTRLNTLNITFARITALLAQVLDAAASFSPIENLKRLFKPLVDDILTFVSEITQKVLEFVIKAALKLAGPYAGAVWGVIEQARDAIRLILEDPLGFAKNLVRAVVGGFQQFGTNILDHLKKGVLGWLFGAMAGLGIELPERLDFRGLMSILLQIVGITYANFRKILVKKLGPKGEKMVSFIETSVEIVRVLITEGFLGVWQKILGMIDSFRETIIGGIGQMVSSAIVKAGIGWLAGLSNPIGAVIKVVLAIYDLVVTFLERLQQIAAVAQSVFSSMASIARGQVQTASDFIEQTIGRTVPVVLSFLAALIGLNGIPARISAVFDRLRAPVLRAMEKMVDFVVKKAKALFSKLIGKINSKRKLPGKTFKVGKTEHSIFAEKKGKGLRFMVASENPKPIESVDAATHAEVGNIKEEKSKQDADKLAEEVRQTDKNLDPFEKTNPENEKTPNKSATEKMTKTMDTDTSDLTREGAAIDSNIATTSNVEGTAALFRAKEPRIEGLEGLADGAYSNLKKRGEAVVAAKKFSFKMSDYYELDHTMEKQFPKLLLENLHLLGSKPTDDAQSDLLRSGKPREARNLAAGRAKGGAFADPAAAPLGKLGSPGFDKISEDAPQFPAIALYKGNHIVSKGKGLPGPEEIVKTARAAGGANPGAVVKQSLKRQVEAEVGEIRLAMGKDKDATPEIKASVEAGLAQMLSFNNGLYGMNATKPAPAVPLPNAADLNAGKGSEFAFGGAGVPDFEKQEGAGGPYSARQAGLGLYFEYDHIIDKAYPKRAQALTIATEAMAAEIRQRLLPLGPMTAAQDRRLKILQLLPLFGGGPMQRYTDETGFAVPIYRPLAKEVTRHTGVVEDVARFASQGATAAIAPLTEHVASGDLGAKEHGLAILRAPMKEGFLSRTDHHSNSVRSLYAAQRGIVLKINPAERAAEVNAKMDRIIGNVEAALVQARRQTEALF